LCLFFVPDFPARLTATASYQGGSPVTTSIQMTVQ
jgi:hypothetical protein